MYVEMDPEEIEVGRSEEKRRGSLAGTRTYLITFIKDGSSATIELTQDGIDDLLEKIAEAK